MPITENYFLFQVQAKWFGPSEVEEAIEQIDGVLEACVWVSILTYFTLEKKNLVH